MSYYVQAIGGGQVERDIGLFNSWQPTLGMGIMLASWELTKLALLDWLWVRPVRS